MNATVNDVRYSIRSLLKHPGFTALAVITLALGIGANTAIFSLINSLILLPPPIKEPDQVVALWKTPVGSQTEGFVSYLDLQDWRTRNHSFEDIAGHKSQGYTFLNQGEGERVQGMRVTANFFPLLKVAPLRGRGFEFADEQRGAAPVALISYEFWMSRFGGNEATLNQQITLNRKSYTIVGIMPPNFEFPFSAKESSIWTTVADEGGNLSERGAQVLRAIGRMKNGVSIELAQSDMAAIAAGLAQEYPGANRNTTVQVVSAQEQIIGPRIRRALWLLLGVVAFILLIACTNMANLMLVRASTRQKEVAIRTALGAGRWHLARLLLMESILLSLLSGATGVFLAVWGLRVLKIFGTAQLPRLDKVTVDTRVLMFAVGLSILTGLIFSILPALKVSRPNVNEVLKAGTRGASSGKNLRRWRDSLAVAEVALSLTLLVGAGLMIRSLAQLANVSPGFDPDNVLTGRIMLSNVTYEDIKARTLFVDQAIDKLNAVPGVESAAFVAPMPFSGENVGGDFRIEGRAVPEPGFEPSADFRSVSTAYFQTMKILLIKGRLFNPQDRTGAIGAAIVNQSFVRRYFPGEDPIGKRLSQLGANQNDGDPELWEVVGVVGDVHHSSLTDAAKPELFLPYQQNSWSWGNFLVRTNGPPEAIAAALREQVRAIDKTIPISNVRSLNEAIGESVSASRFYALLFGLFGSLGLIMTDVMTFGFATVVLLLSAAFATYVPARRATRIDPLMALRYE